MVKHLVYDKIRNTVFHFWSVGILNHYHYYHHPMSHISLSIVRLHTVVAVLTVEHVLSLVYVIRNTPTNIFIGLHSITEPTNKQYEAKEQKHIVITL